MIYFILILVFGFATSTSQDIVGFVRNGATNQAIIGAVVNINGDNNDYLSQNDGSFRINGKHSGKYTLSANYQNYQSADIVLEHNAEKDSQVNFNLALSPSKENRPPTIPLRIAPQNIVVSDDNFLDLNWYSIDPDGDPVVYRVFFDTDSARLKPIKAFYKFDKLTVANIPYDKQYFWKIIARDDKGAESEGPVWSFILKKETESEEEEEEECLVAHWSFDEDNVNDVSGNDYNGTVAGTYSFKDGISGRCISFSGRPGDVNTGGHVMLPSIDFNQFNEFTITLWIDYRSIDSPIGQGIINFGTYDKGTLGMSFMPIQPYNPNNSQKYLRFFTNAVWTQASDSIHIMYPIDDSQLAGDWRMLTMTYKSGSLTAYLDKEKIGEKEMPITQHFDLANAIARHWWSNGTQTATRLNADIDEVKIYCRALSQEEVFTNYDKLKK